MAHKEQMHEESYTVLPITGAIRRKIRRGYTERREKDELPAESGLLLTLDVFCDALVALCDIVDQAEIVCPTCPPTTAKPRHMPDRAELVPIWLEAFRKIEGPRRLESGEPYPQPPFRFEVKDPPDVVIYAMKLAIDYARGLDGPDDLRAAEARCAELGERLRAAIGLLTESDTTRARVTEFLDAEAAKK